jgi:uncharacterized protein YggE
MMLVFALAVAVPAAAQVSPTAPISSATPRIVTTGQSVVRVTPDRATVYIGVMTRASTAAAAAAQNAPRQRAVLDTIRASGVPAEQLATHNYRATPEMQYDREGRTPPRVTGYIVNNTVRVELRRIDQVGGVIDASLAKGANQVNGIEFSVSTADDARRKALSQAVAQARADAEAMAAAAGGRLGELIELSTSAPAYRPMFAMAEMRQDMAAPAPPTPVEPGEQSLSAFVSASWTFVR